VDGENVSSNINDELDSLLPGTHYIVLQAIDSDGLPTSIDLSAWTQDILEERRLRLLKGENVSAELVDRLVARIARRQGRLRRRNARRDWWHDEPGPHMNTAA